IKATSVAISFDLKRMLGREFIAHSITLNNANISLLRNADGTENFKFKNLNADSTNLSSSQTRTSSVKFELGRVIIKNCNFRFLNLQRPQSIDFAIKNTTIRLKHFEDGIEASLLGEVNVNQLLFNVRKGAFLKNKKTKLDLQAVYFKETKRVCILPSSNALIAGQSFGISALID